MMEARISCTTPCKWGARKRDAFTCVCGVRQAQAALAAAQNDKTNLEALSRTSHETLMETKLERDRSPKNLLLTLLP